MHSFTSSKSHLAFGSTLGVVWVMVFALSNCKIYMCAPNFWLRLAQYVNPALMSKPQIAQTTFHFYAGFSAADRLGKKSIFTCCCGLQLNGQTTEPK